MNTTDRPRTWIAKIVAAAFLMFVLVTGAAMRVQGQTFTVLHRFSGGDGAEPMAALIMDPAGNLYGTTFSGRAPKKAISK